MVLLDTNILFSAMFAAHERHESVHEWLSSLKRFGTCGMTQIGAFRLLLNDIPMHGHPLDPVDAHAVIADFVRDERHTFISCGPISPDFVGKTSGHRASFDDYLVQVAHAAGGKLATADRRLVSRWPTHTLLVE